MCWLSPLAALLLLCFISHPSSNSLALASLGFALSLSASPFPLTPPLSLSLSFDLPLSLPHFLLSSAALVHLALNIRSPSPHLASLSLSSPISCLSPTLYPLFSYHSPHSLSASSFPLTHSFPARSLLTPPSHLLSFFYSSFLSRTHHSLSLASLGLSLSFSHIFHSPHPLSLSFNSFLFPQALPLLPLSRSLLTPPSHSLSLFCSFFHLTHRLLALALLGLSLSLISFTLFLSLSLSTSSSDPFLSLSPLLCCSLSTFFCSSVSSCTHCPFTRPRLTWPLSPIYFLTTFAVLPSLFSLTLSIL